jgi:hypothetical protein
MSVEQWWNDTERGTLKYIEKNITECGWHIDGWVQSNGGLLLTGQILSNGENYYKACEVDG